ncbi:enhancer of mRNA-decapping protein 4-like [Pyrus ussuriensis x Pyrus communis]|uniref:Enhancer of mRNA-decapping protein 4-like n=1 Tax=Pyrus ussuriensis x Pyrus communis TaxID=2448454 RepID=A0A5N5HVM0_9ROSA|nr:enhancer of mRNA-decapping protein 4-like [Pyrus ussuriensis x Pyrus communis]
MAVVKWTYSDGRQPPPVSMNLAVGKRHRPNYEIALYFSDRSCSYWTTVDFSFCLSGNYSELPKDLKFLVIEAINSASSLISLAAARGNSSAVNPLVTQLSNGPLGGLHEKRECVKCVDADDSVEFGDTPQLAEKLPSMLLSLAWVLKRSIQYGFANNVGIVLNIIKTNISNYRSANVW